MENSQNLFNKFNIPQDYYIRNWIWQDREDSFGFSLIKEYPTNIRYFKPAITKSGSIDSVVLIKIAVFPRMIEKDNLYVMNLSVDTTSKYRLEKENELQLDFNYEDDNCPTKESLEASANSRQPISLSDKTKYRFNYIDNTFYDCERNISVSGIEIVNYIFQKHLETINNTRGLLLRIKSKVKMLVSTGLFHTAKGLSVAIFPLTGRKIENKYYNMPIVSFYYATNPKEYEDNFGTPNHLLNLDGLLKITPLAALISSFTIISLFIIGFYFGKNPLNLVSFFKEYKDSEIFSVSLIILVVLFWNRILPFILLRLLNSIISLQQWVDSLKFRI